MSVSNPVPPGPFSSLHRHRILSPNAAVRVSPLCLGGMNFGTAWSELLGPMEKSAVFEVLDYFQSQGGNFIDTANNYQSGESEEWIGDWMESRGVREQMVVATKYGAYYKHKETALGIRSNYGGNHTKSMRLSVEASLKKLRTSYIDILYVHWWDYTTSIAELMQSLNQLVASGLVLYLGVSDTPAWLVSKANEYARCHGLRGFCIYQGKWSAAERDFERDIIPMARSEGMALAPWGALGGGYFKTRDQLRAKSASNEGRKEPDSSTLAHATISKVLERISASKAQDSGDDTIPLTSIALAYIMQKTPFVFPVLGGRKVSQLKDNIEALSLELSAQEIKDIEAAIPFDVGFPVNFFTGQRDPGMEYGIDRSWLTAPWGHFDLIESIKPIRPHKK